MVLFPRVHLFNKQSDIFKDEQNRKTIRSASDVTKLHMVSKGVVIVMFTLVSLAFLRTIGKDFNQQ